MPKMKTHKGMRKRMRVTANGKVRHKRANGSHLMSTKNGSRVRKLRRPVILKSSRTKLIKTMLGKA